MYLDISKQTIQTCFIMGKYPDGITVIICCYNSVQRLSKTLQALSTQQCSITWELLIVDNASEDNSAEYAVDLWKMFRPDIPIRVVEESIPGLSNARKTGIKTASYANVLFCDDDNWLNEQYVQGMYNMLMSDSQTAACGGMGIPIFESKEPYWFYEYAEAYALGSQKINSEHGNILNLYGAGLAIKKSALDKLYKSGFDSVLQDRVGMLLSSAGDTELTYALVLLGYKLQCSNELKFFHFLTKERLTVSYLKRLFTSFGNDGPMRNLYYSFVSQRLTHKLIKVWVLHLLLSILRLFKYWVVPPKKYGRDIYFSWSLAYINSLWAIRKNYSELKINISKLHTIGQESKIAHTDKNDRISEKHIGINSPL